MEETKMEKQNRILKTVLLVLIIPIVAVVSIAAYHFLTKSDSDDFASKEKRTQKVSRSEPNDVKADSSPAAAATPAVVNSATPTAAATPSNTPTQPKTQDSSLPFLGKWTFTNPNNGEKITHIFRTPRKTGNSETGNWLLIEPYGKESSSTYRVSGINRLQVKYEGSDDWVNCSYDVYDSGRSMNFLCDGNPSMALTRSR